MILSATLLKYRASGVTKIRASLLRLTLINGVNNIERNWYPSARTIHSRSFTTSHLQTIHLLVDKNGLHQSLSNLPQYFKYRSRKILAQLKPDPHHPEYHQIYLSQLSKLARYAIELPTTITSTTTTTTPTPPTTEQASNSNNNINNHSIATTRLSFFEQYLQQIHSIVQINQIPKDSHLFHQLYFQLLFHSLLKLNLNQTIQVWSLLVDYGFRIPKNDYDAVQQHFFWNRMFMIKKFYFEELFLQHYQHGMTAEFTLPLPIYLQGERLNTILHAIKTKREILHERVYELTLILKATQEYQLLFQLIRNQIIKLNNQSDKVPPSPAELKLQEKIQQILSSLPLQDNLPAESQSISLQDSKRREVKHYLEMIQRYFYRMSTIGYPIKKLKRSLLDLQNFVFETIYRIKKDSPMEDESLLPLNFMIHTRFLPRKQSDSDFIFGLKSGNELLCLQPYLSQIQTIQTSSTSPPQPFHYSNPLYYDDIINQIMLYFQLPRELPESTDQVIREISETLSDVYEQLLKIKQITLPPDTPAFIEKLMKVQLSLCFMEALRRNVVQYKPQSPFSIEFIEQKLQRTFQEIVQTLQSIPQISSTLKQSYLSSALHFLIHFYDSIAGETKQINRSYYFKSIRLISKHQKTVPNALFIPLKPLTLGLILRNAPQNMMDYKNKNDPSTRVFKDELAFNLETSNHWKTEEFLLPSTLQFSGKTLKRIPSAPTLSVATFVDTSLITPKVRIEQLEKLSYLEILKGRLIVNYYLNSYTRTISYFKELNELNQELYYPIEPLIFQMIMRSFIQLIDKIDNPEKLKQFTGDQYYTMKKKNTTTNRSDAKKYQLDLNSLQAIIYDPKPIIDWILKLYVMQNFSLFDPIDKFLFQSISSSHAPSSHLLFTSMQLFAKCLYILNYSHQIQRSAANGTNRATARLIKRAEECLTFWFAFHIKLNHSNHRISPYYPPPSAQVIMKEVTDEWEQVQLNKYELFASCLSDYASVDVFREFVKGCCHANEEATALNFVVQLHNTYHGTINHAQPSENQVSFERKKSDRASPRFFATLKSVLTPSGLTSATTAQPELDKESETGSDHGKQNASYAISSAGENVDPADSMWCILLEPILQAYISDRRFEDAQQLLINNLVNFGYPLTNDVMDTFVTYYIREKKSNYIHSENHQALDLIQEYYHQFNIRPSPHYFRKLLILTMEQKDLYEEERIYSFAKSLYPFFDKYLRDHPVKMFKDPSLPKLVKEPKRDDTTIQDGEDVTEYESERQLKKERESQFLSRLLAKIFVTKSK